MTHVSSSLLSSLGMWTETQAAWGRKHDWVQGKHSYFVMIVRRWLCDSRGTDGQLPLHTSITYNLSFPKAAPSRGSPMSPTSALCLTRSEKSQMCSIGGGQNHPYFPPLSSSWCMQLTFSSSAPSSCWRQLSFKTEAKQQELGAEPSSPWGRGGFGAEGAPSIHPTGRAGCTQAARL